LTDGLTYQGQLGIYHVEVRDGSGTVLAETTFSDAGGIFSCALTTAGGVECWGAGYWGSLGDGSFATGSGTPVGVTGLSSGVVQITVGYGHACALTVAGAVKCWGANFFGALGNGSVANSATPVNVSGLTSGVAQISAGGYHTCAATTGGGAKCWGYNFEGQLGIGIFQTSPPYGSLTPVDVSGLTEGVMKISAGGVHTCAVTTGGDARCWGSNSDGQLGDGTFNSSATPIGLSGLTSSMAQISGGWYHTCAVTTGGAAKCWGHNRYGQLGDGTTTTSDPFGIPMPVDVIGLTSGVARISSGNSTAGHTCAVTIAGGAKCWGYNYDGRLGSGTFTPFPPYGVATPVDVSGLTSGVAQISTSAEHTCAMTTAGGAKCWGYNGLGQLGDGTYTDSPVPVDVSGLTSGVGALWDGEPITLSDVEAPTATPTRAPAANAAGWNNSDVTVTWHWTDAGSAGIDNANCIHSSTSVEEGNLISLTATCQDLAGNIGHATYTVMVDKTTPMIVLVGGPANRGNYYFGAVPAAPTCSASDALSGLDDVCLILGYSDAVGTHTVTASATDNAGNEKTASRSYTVLPWTFSGFYQPVAMGGAWNRVKNGSTVPIKFEVFAGSTELTHSSIVIQPLTGTRAPCSNGGLIDEVELAATGGTTLRYDVVSGQFVYNWKTPRQPGYCYTIRVTLTDGTSRQANFQLR
jgi:alpha-tubulin suppressor-like RCC1 family protein